MSYCTAKDFVKIKSFELVIHMKLDSFGVFVGIIIEIIFDFSNWKKCFCINAWDDKDYNCKKNEIRDHFE